MSKLGNYVSIQNGYAFKSKDFIKNTTGTPVIKIGNVTGGSFIDLSSYDTVSEEVANKAKSFQTKDDDILIAMTGANVGKVSRVAVGTEPCLINQRVGRFVLKEHCLYSPDFIYYLASSYKSFQYFSSTADGAAQPNISGKLIEELEFPDILPELANKAGEYLKVLDQKIQLNTQINQTLEQIAQAIFKSWFVDFDPVRAKAAALESGKTQAEAEFAAMQAISGKTAEELAQMPSESYAELAEIAKAFPSEFGEDGVPMGWEVAELGSLMTIKRGGSPRPIKDYISDSGLNWVKISDATAENNPFLFSTKEYIKLEGLSKTILLKQGSLILSNSATPGLPRFLELDACIHDGWLYFSDIKKLTQEYLYFFFLHIRNNLVSQGNGSVFTNLKTDIVKSQKSVVPNENIMNFFNTYSKKLMQLIRENTLESILLKETRDLLLPRLLSGEIQL
ncbi:restriction endonuclease subunit S [Aggregatibacter actinomycetemcomitans]|uniref:restriction endonuclease subunit S n=1 Tax=Aggregatibacter actinomycetemcomitans TaxID=714 RepID=UPI00197B4728|nr:restriction endonuclease subunit S [Aggregatibacter actinomycetemcomitans]MBN6080163.1 restriction endonuclease subunit S [Aggregatibacter actinomycetemcomitans]